jgi:hypothetical protein
MKEKSMSTPIAAGPLPGKPILTGNQTVEPTRPLEINPDADLIIRAAAAGLGKKAEDRATYGPVK